MILLLLYFSPFPEDGADLLKNRAKSPVSNFPLFLDSAKMAEISGQSFIPESFQGYTPDIFGQIGLVWELIKAPLIVPVLRICVYICLAMSIMVFMERLYMGVVIVLVKLFWRKPEKRYKWEPIRDDDLEMGSGAFPVVLVQIPMFNEKEVSVSVCFLVS